jgi:hypothetical protein
MTLQVVLSLSSYVNIWRRFEVTFCFRVQLKKLFLFGFTYDYFPLKTLFKKQTKIWFLLADIVVCGIKLIYN